jgi:hypothetical protein
MHPYDLITKKLLQGISLADFSDEEIRQTKLLLCQNIRAAYVSIEEMTKKLIEVELEIASRRKSK